MSEERGFGVASASFRPEPIADGEYYGSKTLSDGSRVALTADEAKALWEAVEASQEKAKADFPNEQSALREISRAMQRLRDFGWRDAIYSPKDGSEFEVIEAGSTGVFRCYYDGKWPDGTWMTSDDRDIYPSSKPPLMFRLLPEAQAEHDRKMADAIARFHLEEWPNGCPKRSSCARNRGCMYGCKAHAGRPPESLKREIDAALADATKKETP